MLNGGSFGTMKDGLARRRGKGRGSWCMRMRVQRRQKLSGGKGSSDDFRLRRIGKSRRSRCENARGQQLLLALMRLQVLAGFRRGVVIRPFWADLRLWGDVSVYA